MNFFNVYAKLQPFFSPVLLKSYLYKNTYLLDRYVVFYHKKITKQTRNENGRALRKRRDEKALDN